MTKNEPASPAGVTFPLALRFGQCLFNLLTSFVVQDRSFERALVIEREAPYATGQ